MKTIYEVRYDTEYNLDMPGDQTYNCSTKLFSTKEKALKYLNTDIRSDMLDDFDDDFSDDPPKELTDGKQHESFDVWNSGSSHLSAEINKRTLH